MQHIDRGGVIKKNQVLSLWSLDLCLQNKDFFFNFDVQIWDSPFQGKLQSV